MQELDAFYFGTKRCPGRIKVSTFLYHINGGFSLPFVMPYFDNPTYITSIVFKRDKPWYLVIFLNRNEVSRHPQGSTHYEILVLRQLNYKLLSIRPEDINDVGWAILTYVHRFVGHKLHFLTRRSSFFDKRSPPSKRTTCESSDL
jgi:hypothetical protein